MLKPYKKKLLVKPDPDATMTAGGLHIVETRKTERQPTKYGTVFSAGQSEIAVFSPGDRILFTPDVMTPIEVEGPNGEKLVLIRDSDVLALVE